MLDFLLTIPFMSPIISLFNIIHIYDIRGVFVEKPNAKNFFKYFNEIFSVKREDAVKYYADNTSFTTFITNELCSLIKNKYSLKPECEYFRIDVIGYKSNYDNVKQTANTAYIEPYAWDMKIAVEHENNDKLWMDEIVKLAHVYAPLRVVIGYLPVECRKNGEDDKCLEYIVNVIKNNCSAYHTLLDESNEFLIIIGNSKTHYDKTKYFDYIAYKFNPNTEHFEIL